MFPFNFPGIWNSWGGRQGQLPMFNLNTGGNPLDPTAPKWMQWLNNLLNLVDRGWTIFNNRQGGNADPLTTNQRAGTLLGALEADLSINKTVLIVLGIAVLIIASK